MPPSYSSSFSFMFRAPSVHLGCTAAWRLIVPAPYSILFPLLPPEVSPRLTRRESSKLRKVELFVGQKLDRWFCLEMPTSTIHARVLLHAVNLRHGTDGFTSPPKEGVLRNFSPLKIRRLRPGLNPRTWVLKANTPYALQLLLYPIVLHRLYCKRCISNFWSLSDFFTILMTLPLTLPFYYSPEHAAKHRSRT